MTTFSPSKERALVEAAARIIAGEGVRALSLRRLAGEVGASTMAVYTWYGSKPNLLRAVYREAFSRFGDELRTAAGDGAEPLAELVRIGRAYRIYAITEPNLYAVMFGTDAQTFEPGEEELALALGTFALLVEAVARCVEAGILRCEPADGAWQIWASVHGAVSLTMVAGDSGHLGRDAGGEAYSRLATTVLVGLGADRRQVEAAIASAGVTGG